MTGLFAYQVYERKFQLLQQEVEGLKSENESLKSECSALKTNAEILELELQRCRSAMDAMQTSNESSKRRDLNSVVSTAKQTRESLARVDNACKNLERRKELEDNYVQVFTCHTLLTPCNTVLSTDM